MHPTRDHTQYKLLGERERERHGEREREREGRARERRCTLFLLLIYPWSLKRDHPVPQLPQLRCKCTLTTQRVPPREPRFPQAQSAAMDLQACMFPRAANDLRVRRNGAMYHALNAPLFRRNSRKTSGMSHACVVPNRVQR